MKSIYSLQNMFVKIRYFAIATAVAGLLISCAKKPEQNQTGRTDITLKIPGVTKPFTFVHVSDMHICECDSRNSEMADFVARRTKVFTGADSIDPNQTAINLFNQINKDNPDLVAITGDFVDTPTEASIDAATKLVNLLNAAAIFSIGNHEWLGRILEKYSETKVYADRDFWVPRFEKWANQPIEFYIRRMYGINMICINHSAEENRITSQQLEQTKNVLDEGRPCIFFLHVPLPLNSPGPENITETTLAFYRLLKTHPLVYAIFAGHKHLKITEELRPGCFQYTVAPGFENSYNYVTVIPSE